MTTFFESLTQQRARRSRLVDRDGSPEFTWHPANIAASGNALIEIGRQFPAARKYEPLNHTEIVNNSTENLRIEINGDSIATISVPAGVIRTLANRAIWLIRVVNTDGANATTSPEIELRFSRPPIDADERARRSG